MISLLLLHHPSSSLSPTTTTTSSQFGSLSLCYKSLTALDYIPPSFLSLTQLYLNHNKLTSLCGIQPFSNLKVLHFKFNYVEGFEELKRVKNPFFMESLAVTGNPMEFDRRCCEEGVKGVFGNLKEYNVGYGREKERKGESGRRGRGEEEEGNVFVDPETSRVSSNTFSLNSFEKIKSYEIKQPDSLLKTKRFTLNNQSTKHQSSLHPYSSSSLPSTQLNPLRTLPPHITPFQDPSLSPPRKTARFPTSNPPSLNNTKHHQTLKHNRTELNNQSSIYDSELTINLIDEHNEYLAEAYYWRSLVEKCWKGWREEGREEERREMERVGRMYEEGLKLKGWISLRASVSLRRVEREYMEKKGRIGKLEREEY